MLNETVSDSLDFVTTSLNFHVGRLEELFDRLLEELPPGSGQLGDLS